MSRKAYLLTGNVNSERCQFSKNILEKVGFQVIAFIFFPHEKKLTSNRISMLAIYEIIAKGDDEWVYVFEDDINIMEDMKIDEIVQYESISEHFFYLGLCIAPANRNDKLHLNENKINGNDVVIMKGNVKGLHAIGLSKNGAKELMDFEKKYDESWIMDMILEEFSILHPANVVRYDLEHSVLGHRGIFFQDQQKFPSTIWV